MRELRDVLERAFSTIVIASVTASVVSRAALGRPRRHLHVQDVEKPGGRETDDRVYQ